VWVGSLASAWLGLAACALDEGGAADGGFDAAPIDAPVDQTQSDVTQDVVSDLNVPDQTVNDASDAGDAADVIEDADASDAADAVTTCEIDASCVATIPEDAGWTLLGISTDGGSCNLQSGTLLDDASLAPDACACGCATQGTPTCGSATFVGYTDPACTMDASAGTVAPNGCADVGDLLPDAGISVSPGNVSGVTCTSSITGSQTAVAQSFATCTATTCTDNYCGLRAKGFLLCIAHDPPVTTCPTGFPVRIDAVASASASCNGCSCDVKDPACTGTVTTYDASACGGGSITSFAASACSPLTDETLSIGYVPDPPPSPTCGATSLGGSVQTLGSTVVCCAP